MIRVDRSASWGPLAFTLVVGVTLATTLTLLALPRGAGVVFLPSRPATQPAAPLTSSPTTPAPTPVAPPPAAADLHAAWVSQSAYAIVGIGEIAELEVRFRNTGTAPWARGTASEVRLALVNADEVDPRVAVGWPFPERPAVQAERFVAPGETGTFRFTVKAVEPGEYRLRLRPVVDGVVWLEDRGVFLIVQVLPH